VSVHAVASQLIHAAPERVSAIYQDYGHWPQLFPGTIRATRLIRENDTTKAIEVEHAIVRRRIAKFVLQPIKAMAESAAG